MAALPLAAARVWDRGRCHVQPTSMSSCATWISYLHEKKTTDADWFEFAIMHHTDCGSGFFADDELRHGFAACGFAARGFAARGFDDAELKALAVLDPVATVPGDVDKLLAMAPISARIKVCGFAYDVKTGVVTRVVAPRSRQEG
jgi:carbonic anhydrase